MTLRTILPHLPLSSRLAALGSLVSLGAQGLFAVFLLKLFDATAVGEFSVVSQIAFCWATLALAQSPLSLLANHQVTAHAAASQAWAQSAVRMVWMGPWALLALWWSQNLHPLTRAHWSALAPWLAGIAVLQMSWLLAQSLTLRTQASAAVAWVRLLPPVLAALIAWLGAALMGAAGSDTLLLSALLGYGAGAAWILPALRPATADLCTATAPARIQPEGDVRSTRLKLLHTLTDVAVSGLLAVQWQALYGTAEAGMLLVLLRVFGFIPGLVNSAWAQVMMSHGTPQRRASLGIAALACGVILAIAAAIALALQWGWLQASWQGLNHYLWPLACWQMAACVMAALAHLPFLHQRPVRFSWQCIGMNVGLVAGLLLPLSGLVSPLTAQQHLLAICGFMGLALLAQALDHGLTRQRR